MLDRAHRLTTGTEFATAVRRGRRAGTETLVVHLWTPGHAGDAPDPSAPPAPARVGFVVGRTVGDAVTRNRVKRRLRHLVRPTVDALPVDSLLVVRALSPAGAASGLQLADDLDRALTRVLRPKEARR